MRRLICLVSIIVLPTLAQAMTMREETFICPVNNESFKQTLPASGFATGMTLDFQLQGLIASPQPMPVCPGNGFAMYKNEYSADEIARIKTMIKQPEFADLRARNNEWLLAVWEMKQLDQDPREIASMYLAATWQAAFDYQPVVAEAYDFVSKLNSPEDALILGEWERRLGRFEAARQRFSNLPQQSRDALIAVGWNEARLQAYVDQQLALISVGNSGQASFVEK